jgi:hypothetical protein
MRALAPRSIARIILHVTRQRIQLAIWSFSATTTNVELCATMIRPVLPPAASKCRTVGDLTAISPVSFWLPDYECPSEWIEYAPFAFWICEALRPIRFVELGTHHGYSYFAFCQAIDRLRIGTTAYAIDSCKGDEHTGFYDESVFRSVSMWNEKRYSAFSSLIRSTFDDAVDYCADGSVELLHIDGRHFYDDVEHDFTLWRPEAH